MARMGGGRRETRTTLSLMRCAPSREERRKGGKRKRRKYESGRSLASTCPYSSGAAEKKRGRKEKRRGEKKKRNTPVGSPRISPRLRAPDGGKKGKGSKSPSSCGPYLVRRKKKGVEEKGEREERNPCSYFLSIRLTSLRHSFPREKSRKEGGEEGKKKKVLISKERGVERKKERGTSSSAEPAVRQTTGRGGKCFPTSLAGKGDRKGRGEKRKERIFNLLSREEKGSKGSQFSVLSACRPMRKRKRKRLRLFRSCSRKKGEEGKRKKKGSLRVSLLGGRPVKGGGREKTKGRGVISLLTHALFPCARGNKRKKET